MRPIDADTINIVGAEIDKNTDAASFVKGMKHVMKQIKQAPTIDNALLLPCKVGDTVYYIETIQKNIHGIFQCEVSEIRVTWAGVDIILSCCEKNYHIPRWKYVMPNDFGKIVFLSREAAEVSSNKS